MMETGNTLSPGEKKEILRMKRRRYEISEELRGAKPTDLFDTNGTAAAVPPGKEDINEKKRRISEDMVSHIITDPAGSDPEFEKLISANSQMSSICSLEMDKFRSTYKTTYKAFETGKDDSVRRLFYKRQAVFYHARWMLELKPVDNNMAKIITTFMRLEPDTIDDGLILNKVSGFTLPIEKEEIPISDLKDPDEVYRLAEEVAEYFYSHPYQFESQCLLSVISGTEQLGEIRSQARAILRWIDATSLEDSFADLDNEELKKRCDLWVMADAIYKISSSVIEFLYDCKDLTVGEASVILSKRLPKMSYSAIILRSGDILRHILEERGHR